MGETFKSKGFCGCISYKAVAIIALIIEIIYFVLCILARV